MRPTYNESTFLTSSPTPKAPDADFSASIRNRPLEAFLRSKCNKKHHSEKLRVSAFQFRRNQRLRMRLSRATAISNRTAPRSDASGVAPSAVMYYISPKARRQRRPTAERSGRNRQFGDMVSKSLFIPLPEVEIQQK